MIYTRVLVCTILLSLMSATGASTPTSLRKMQETSLGAAFLAMAQNYIPSSTTMQTSGYFSAEMEVSAIGPLGRKIDPLCEQFDGYVEYEARSGNETVTTSYSVRCHFPVDEYDMFEDAVAALLEDYTYRYGFSSYVDRDYMDPAIYLAQQKAIENLMVTADPLKTSCSLFRLGKPRSLPRAIHLP